MRYRLGCIPYPSSTKRKITFYGLIHNMCFPCWPFVDLKLEEPPKKKRKRKKESYNWTGYGYRYPVSNLQ